MDTKYLKILLLGFCLCADVLAQEWTESPALSAYLKLHQVFSITPLVGGESNDRLFKLRTGGGVWVVRALDQRRSLKKRRLVCEATKLMGEKNLGPKVIWHDDSYEFLITEFIEGRPLTPEDIQDPKIFQKLIFLVKEAHVALGQLTSSLETYSLKDRVLQRLKEIASYVVDLRELTNVRSVVEKITIINPYNFSHGDIKGENILKTQTGLFLIDWGDVGFSSIYDDLASISFHFSLDEDRENRLLNLYFGHPPGEEALKILKLHKWLAELQYRLWCMRKKQEEARKP